MGSDCCSRAGGWSPSDWKHAYSSSWATRTWRGRPSTSARRTPGRSFGGIGLITGVVTRSRFGITLTVLGVLSAVATAVDPREPYNVRLLPLWFISVYFMAAWAFGYLVHDRGDCVASGPVTADTKTQSTRRLRGSAANGPGTTPATRESRFGGGARQPGDRPAWPPAAHRAPRRWAQRPSVRHPRPARGHGGGRAALHLPGLVAPGDGRPQPGHELVQLQLRGLRGTGLVSGVPLPHADDGCDGKRYGCGRAMWEYSASENRFGTPEALCSFPTETERLHRLDGGPALRVLGDDAVPLPEPGRSCPQGRPSPRLDSRTGAST